MYRTGFIVDEIEMPTEVSLTPTFGGPHLDELFVTSGTINLNLGTGQTINSTLSPLSGSLFKIVGYGAKGYPGRRIRL